MSADIGVFLVIFDALRGIQAFLPQKGELSSAERYSLKCHKYGEALVFKAFNWGRGGRAIRQWAPFVFSRLNTD